MASYREVKENEWGGLRRQIHSTFPIVQMVIDGLQQGQGFKSDAGDVWVLHNAGFSELFLTNDDGKGWVDFLISEKALPRYFHLYEPKETLVNIIKDHQNFINLRERGRIQLGYDHQTVLNVNLPSGYKLEAVSRTNFATLSVFNLNLENRFWKSSEEFVSHANGMVAVDEIGNPVALCYAAAITNDCAEIDVITLEKHRGRGLANSVVKGFINNLDKKIKPNWDCFIANVHSLNVARGIGFKEKKFYPLVSLLLK